jgi:hypothetical protein
VLFTGGFLIASGFMDEFYVHMGFHPAWKYKKVHELIFEKGHLVQASDKSQKIAEIRSKMRNLELSPMPGASLDEFSEWINNCFSRDYSL